ncbi:MAG: hypothetical protein U0271_12945 [Polyangiaceae bacterium]
MLTHTYRFEYATQANVVPTNLATKLCSALDVNCLSPDPNAPQPDSEGRVSFTVADNFTGFLEVSSDDTLPSLVFFQPPVIIPGSEKVIRLIREDEFLGLNAAAGQTWDQSRGVAVILTANCNDERSAGIRVESDDIDADTVPYYFTGALPNPDAKKTDSQGVAGFLNMPIGVINVRSYVFENDVYIGTNTLRSRAGYLSYLPIGPSL